VNLIYDSAALDRVFGGETQGATPLERARTSKREFVRGQSMLAQASPEAKGRRLAAAEALRIFGFDYLQRAVDDGQVVIVNSRDEPAATLRAQRESLGFTRERLAAIAKLKPADIVQAETPGKITSSRILAQLAPILAINDDLLGFRPTESIDAGLGVRFRRLAKDAQRGLSSTAVAALAEAAWIIARQEALVEALGDDGATARVRFQPERAYGVEPYRSGYALAIKTRKLLGIEPGAPIASMRSLIEDTLRIPLVETKMDRAVAGATIANGQHRGIAVNIEGSNTSVWVRRMTLAHELGHLLWDPAERLESLVVDRYADLEGEVVQPQDKVERRANAFAVAFLAPVAEVERLVRSQDVWSAITQISELFGISISASNAHVRNVCKIMVPPAGRRRMPSPSEELQAREDSTNAYFPLASTPESRRGRFARVVVQALDARAISEDTAATLLKVEAAVLRERRAQVLDITSPLAERGPPAGMI
jgi:Zn-dependent peptidase ImmA (M78 family)/antitoxin (DNA-binding transcriptional repressor) of toxin-antitoxin stability system